jgi:hypothetical protein
MSVCDKSGPYPHHLSENNETLHQSGVHTGKKPQTLFQKFEEIAKLWEFKCPKTK